MIDSIESAARATCDAAECILPRCATLNPLCVAHIRRTEAALALIDQPPAKSPDKAS